MGCFFTEGHPSDILFSAHSVAAFLSSAGLILVAGTSESQGGGQESSQAPSQAPSTQQPLTEPTRCHLPLPGLAMGVKGHPQAECGFSVLLPQGRLPFCEVVESFPCGTHVRFFDFWVQTLPGRPPASSTWPRSLWRSSLCAFRLLSHLSLASDAERLPQLLLLDPRAYPSLSLPQKNQFLNVLTRISAKSLIRVPISQSHSPLPYPFVGIYSK